MAPLILPTSLLRHIRLFVQTQADERQLKS